MTDNLALSRADDTPGGAVVIWVFAGVIGLTSVITGLTLMTKQFCDGLANYDLCGDPTTHPYWTLGWLILGGGCGIALIVALLGFVYRQVVVGRRFAEIAARATVR